ncbi:MMPL family transporter [Streptomyces enissocaesilis]|uniref:MMPL family transporter n=1 Tax=Streptomyces enissocaesilis TaxID=332589 RepID=A0ABP6JMY9_9ACTN
MKPDAPSRTPLAPVPPRRAARLLPALLRHPRRLACCGLLAVLLIAAVLAAVPARLSPGGFSAQGTEAVRADAVLRERFAAGLPDLVLRVDAPRGVDDATVTDAGLSLAEEIARRPGVDHVFSYWSGQDPRLVSRDRHSALVTVDLAGDEMEATRTAQALVPQLTGDRDLLRVSATGASWVGAQVSQVSRSDLITAELVGVPLVMVVLLLAFGSVTAALLPAVVGGLAVGGTLAALRVLAHYYPVSVFAPNLAAALGFGLAVDYALFLLTRHREELARGLSPTEAITVTLRTTGRAVLFSAATIATCLAALLLFPLTFLRSLAVTGIVVVVLSAAAALLLLPPALVLLGGRLQRARWLSRPARTRSGALSWTRIARLATDHPALTGAGTAAVLLCLLSPFGHVRFGPADVRVLPTYTESHAVARHIAADFDLPWNRTLQVLLPETDSLEQEAQLDAYARHVSAQPRVAVVDSALGTYRHGQQVKGPGPAALIYTAEGSTWLTVLADGSPTHDGDLIDALRALPAPGPHLVSGEAARQHDTEKALAARLPLAAAWVAVSVAVLLFLLTGSLVLPLKALAVGLLSLGASFGIIVHVFQDGHLLWLLGGATVTGELILPVPVLMFAVALGISIDYEVFLLARVGEAYDQGLRLKDAVVTGVAQTSRVITTAAVLVAVALLPLLTSRLSILKMLGLGLALAVLVDATLVRAFLVPAAMCLLGRANWWAPAPLTRLHQRLFPTAPHHTRTAPLPAPRPRAPAPDTTAPH